MPAPIAFAQANPLQKGLRRFAATAPGSWMFARTLHHIDRPVFRVTRGRHTFASLAAGLPMVMLTTTGAKSGKARTVPLLGLPVDEGVAVIGSNFGQGPQPAWLHNLRANPEATIALGEMTHRVRAIEVTGARRDEIWREGVRIHPGYSVYERRAAHREIAVFVLEVL